MRNRLKKFLTLSSVAIAATLPAAATKYAFGQSAGEPQPVGRITAAFGAASIDGPAGKRPGDLQTLVNNDERIVTDGGGVTLLLASRVVLKIDAHSAVAGSEGAGQTNVLLERGTVHVFVGQRPATSGSVVVQDPNVRAETDSGVFLAHYNPDARVAYYACEHNTIKLTPIDPVAPGGGDPVADEHVVPVIVKPDMQAVCARGGKIDVTELDRADFNSYKQSLDRLGQSTVTQTTETFRIRSRTFDTNIAISQLAAAGWIDRNGLASQGQTSASEKDKDKDKEKD
jgi:hypothetical protein